MECIGLTFLAIMAMAHCNQDAALLMDGNTKLTTKMFSEVAKATSDSSFVLSAFSVLTPLAQLSLGTVGKSHDELLRAIGLPNDESTKSAFAHMKTKLESLKGAELKMANRIYVSKEYSLNKEYAAVTRHTFQSDVTSADFRQAVKTATEINNWVEDQTNHRIKNLIDPNDLSSTTKVVLVNSVYFQSAWKTPFSKDLTLDKDFHVSRHKTVKVPMMRRTSYYKYGQSVELNSTIVELPYVDEDSALYVIVPNDVEGINQLKYNLKESSVLEKALREMKLERVEVQIPRFTIETKLDLVRILPKVGVKRIFDAKEANLTRVLNDQGPSNPRKESNPLFVGQATQKVFMDVNEEGTIAAAANEFKEYPTAVLDQKHFVADRPFVFDIRINNAPVFRGIYTGT